MVWLGLSLVEACWLFVALAVAISALYLGRRNLPVVHVPSLLFWQGSRGSAPGGRLRSLRSPRSLLLALAIVLLLVLALGEPRFGAEPVGRTLVVLLDRSASMAATDERPSRLEAAKRALITRLSALRPRDHFVVLALAERTSPLARADQDLRTLANDLRSLQPSQAQGDLEQGVASALALLAHTKSPELLLLSDGNLSGVPAAQAMLRANGRVKASQQTFGTAQRNLAITQLAARSYPLDRARQELVVSIANTGGQTEAVELLVEAGGTPLLHESLEVPARDTLSRTLRNLVQVGGSVSARLLSRKPDVLATDDKRNTLVPARRRTRVLCVANGNRYLEAALLLDEYLDVTWRAPGETVDTGGYDVAIFDGRLPALPATLPGLYLSPFEQSPAQPLAPNGTRVRPFFEQWDREHPLLHGLALADVNLARAARTTPAPADRVLARAEGGLPLIVEGLRNQQRFIALTFDARESDLPLRPAWPLLLLAAIDRLASVTPLASQRQATPESDVIIAPRSVLSAAAALEPSAGPAQRPPWQLLVLAALLLLSAEWLTFHRRLTS